MLVTSLYIDEVAFRHMEHDKNLQRYFVLNGKTSTFSMPTNIFHRYINRLISLNAISTPLNNESNMTPMQTPYHQYKRHERYGFWYGCNYVTIHQAYPSVTTKYHVEVLRL